MLACMHTHAGQRPGLCSTTHLLNGVCSTPVHAEHWKPAGVQEHAGRQPHAAGPPSSKQKPLLHKGSSSATQLGSLLQPPVSPRLQHAASATAAHPLKHEADLMALSEDSLMEEGSHGSHLSGMPSDLGTPFSNPHDRLGDLDASFYAAGQTASLGAPHMRCHGECVLSRSGHAAYISVQWRPAEACAVVAGAYQLQ